MAVVEKSYLLEYASMTTNGSAVIECVDAFYVTGLTAGAAAMYSAINATGLPVLWSPHPVVPNVNAVSYTPLPKGTNAAVVQVRYVNVQPQLVYRGGCGLTSTLTDVDRNGSPVVVSNQNASATPPVSASAATVIGTQFNILVPEATLVVQRVRPTLALGGIDPIAQQNEYVGTINSGAVFGIGQFKMLCESVSYDNDGLAGVGWRMQYEFRISRKTWYPRVVWIDPNTGQPGSQLAKASGYDAGTPSSPSDTTTGRKVVDSYETKDFSVLLS